MFLKIVILFVAGIYGYFYYLSTLGPGALTKKNLVLYNTPQAAMHTSEQESAAIAGKIDGNEYVVIISTMDGRAFSACEIETKRKKTGWVRCSDLKKV